MKIKYLIVFLLPILFSCNSEPEWKYQFVESEKHSFQKFISTIKNFPYVADDNKVLKIYEGYKLLKISMKKDDVVQILGNPDSETFKYKYPDEVNIISSSFTYYLKRIKKDFADKEDKMFFLYFTQGGNLLGSF